MGYLLVGEVFEALPASELSTPARITLLTLSNFANDKTGRKAYPTMDTLGKYTGLSRKGLYLATRELEAAGYIRATGDKHKYRCVIEDLEWVRATHLVSHGDPLSGSERHTEWVMVTHEPRSNQEENPEENPAAYGHTEENEISSMQPCKKDNEHWNTATLAEHLSTRVMREMREHGGHPTGAVNKRALASRLRKVMEQFELTADELHDLMHVYAKSTTVWNHMTKHPAWDFTAAITLSRLVNMTRPLDIEHHEAIDTTQSAGYLRLMAAAEAAREKRL